jgi:tRNA/rRNA methyltransferase
MGSICRALRNCGLDQLVLVDPAPDLYGEELRKMAMHALPVYEARQEFGTLEEAVADCGAVAMTSGVDGFYRGHALSPREAAPELLSIMGRGSPVAVVFGPEDKGMGLDELKLATHLIRIPSHPEYTSLNLSQSVMLVAHELFQTSGTYSAPDEASPPASFEFRERMLKVWEETMDDIRFCTPEKRPHMMLGLRRIFSRGELSENDVKILMGLARQASWAVKNLPREGEGVEG